MSDNTTESERYLKMSDLKKQADKRYPLWLLFAQEHDLSLTESQLNDIIHAVKKHLANGTPKGNGESSPLEGIVIPSPNEFASYSVEKGGDNLGIVLACYFEEHMDKPDDAKIDTELGWTKWTMDKTEETLKLLLQQMKA